MAAQPVRMTPKPRSKYRAQPTVVDGIRFASAAESRRYSELKLLEKAGDVRALVLQPRFILLAYSTTIPAFVRRAMERSARVAPIELGVYVADFQYELKGAGPLGTWANIVEDVKGFRTPLYRWKKKHVEAQYGIVVREIR